MTLNEAIRARRLQLKMSQEYVADQLGISRQAVAKWEAGTSRPAAANLAELAALFEVSVSELTDPPEDREEARAEETRIREEADRENAHNAKMLLGRWCSTLFINASWDNYRSSAGDPVLANLYLVILGAGILLLFLTSRDMNRRHRLEKPQAALGATMVFSVFFLPQLLPWKQNGLNNLLADLVTCGCMAMLHWKYWRHIWKVQRPHR